LADRVLSEFSSIEEDGVEMNEFDPTGGVKIAT